MMCIVVDLTCNLKDKNKEGVKKMEASGIYYNQETKDNFVKYFLNDSAGNLSQRTLERKKEAVTTLFNAACRVEVESNQDLAEFKFNEQYKKVVQSFPASYDLLTEIFLTAREYIAWCCDNALIESHALIMNPFMKKVNWVRVVKDITIEEYTYVRDSIYLSEICDYSLQNVKDWTKDTKVRCVLFAFYMGVSSEAMKRAEIFDIDLTNNTFLGYAIPDEFLPAFREYRAMDGEYIHGVRGGFRRYADPEKFIRSHRKSSASTKQRGAGTGYITQLVYKYDDNLRDPHNKNIRFRLREVRLYRSKLFNQIYNQLAWMRDIVPNVSHVDVYKLVRKSLQDHTRAASKNTMFNYVEFLFYLKMFYPDMLDFISESDDSK